MNTYDLILKRRTIRKFKQQSIERATLEKLINVARLAPSAANLQPLKYKIVDDTDTVKKVFENVKWAGYIAPTGNPAEGETPVAYIAILVDTEISKGDCGMDIGAAAQNIFLAALEDGIGTCWMGAIDRMKIREILNIPERYVLNTVIALGYPLENPVYENENGSIKYYKDHDGVLHVPKRKLQDIIL
ncbi:MAG TPA: nitroreductase family protein [Clostridia bacterium]|nr:nitroreductase family protein [Clostridia bacterium]